MPDEQMMIVKMFLDFFVIAVYPPDAFYIVSPLELCHEQFTQRRVVIMINPHRQNEPYPCLLPQSEGKLKIFAGDDLIAELEAFHQIRPAGKVL